MSNGLPQTEVLPSQTVFSLVQHAKSQVGPDPPTVSPDADYVSDEEVSDAIARTIERFSMRFDSLEQRLLTLAHWSDNFDGVATGYAPEQATETWGQTEDWREDAVSAYWWHVLQAAIIRQWNETEYSEDHPGDELNLTEFRGVLTGADVGVCRPTQAKALVLDIIRPLNLTQWDGTAPRGLYTAVDEVRQTIETETAVKQVSLLLALTEEFDLLDWRGRTDTAVREDVAGEARWHDSLYTAIAFDMLGAAARTVLGLKS